MKNQKVKYNKAYAIQFLELSKEGKTPNQIAVTFGIPKRYLYEWSKNKRHWEFTIAWEKGLEACQAYYEDQMQQALSENKATLVEKYIAAMKLMFAEWKEGATQIEVKNTGPKLEDLGKEQLLAMLTQLSLKPNVVTAMQQLLDIDPETAAKQIRKFKIVTGNEPKASNGS